MSEREEQVERQEEVGAPARSELEDEPKEAIRQAAEAGYKPPPRSESIEEEEEELAEEEEAAEVEEEEPAEEVPVLDLNAATEKELSTLPGIGPTLAERIVSYREQEGPFREPAEVTWVQGISGATYEAIADRITVGSVPVEEAKQEEVGALFLPAEEVQETEEGEEEVSSVPVAVHEDEPDAEEPDEEEQVAAPVSEAPPAPPPPPQPVRYEPARRGAGWGSLLIVGLLSALGGALLALLVLFLLNGGTLDFERATARAIDREVSQVEGWLMELQAQLDDAQQQLAQVGELSQRLDETQIALSEAQAEIEAMGGAVESLQSDLAVATQGLADVRQTLAGLSDDFTSLAESVTALDEQVSGIEDQLAEMDEQLLALRRAAGRFDTFLFGLRGLLEEAVPGVREQTPTPTPAESSPRVTPTPTPFEPSPTPTPAGATATPASQVTVIPLASPTP